jgi:hypothetical protein
METPQEERVLALPTIAPDEPFVKIVKKLSM